MKKAAIYGRSFDDSFNPFIQELIDRLLDRDIELLIFEPFVNYLSPRVSLPEDVESFSSHSDLKDNCDFLISVGGDGTLLDTITFIRDSGIPILGLNTGRLGFLSNVSKDDIKKAVDALCDDTVTVDERQMLHLNKGGDLFGDVTYALNELTVHKKDSSSMITIHAYINDDYLNSYWADGLIIATPTGSTAYSLSCGGPILAPHSEDLVITPIAPHNLNVRPIVVPDSCEITLRVEGRGREFLAALDSRSATIDASTELVITRCPFSIKLIDLPDQTFFSTIRNKMMWGLDRRN